MKQRKEFYTADGKFEATGEFGERLISEMMEEYASQSSPGSKDFAAQQAPEGMYTRERVEQLMEQFIQSLK